MKICIDAREFKPQMNGLGRYAQKLVQHLAQIDPKHEYLILRHASASGPLVAQENFQDLVLPYGNSSLQNLLFGAFPLRHMHLDIFHALFHFLPLGISAKRVVFTMCDLIWIDHIAISEARWHKRQLNRLAVPITQSEINRSHRIIAISKATKQAIQTRFPVPDQKINVVYPGVDLPDRASPYAEKLPEACKGSPFIFSLGNAKPYKNLGRLILAFHLVLRQIPNLRLIISGRGDGYAELHKLIHRLGLSGRVVLLPSLADEEVQACFHHALFFAFPSLVEGFGFPVLEAMAGNCAVLTSNRSSLPEIAGQAALQVDPLSVDAIARGMVELIHNEPYRRRLAFHGPDHAAKFSWRACAEHTLDIYYRLATQRPAAVPTRAKSNWFMNLSPRYANT